MTGLKKSWVSEPGREMVFYRPEGTGVEFGKAMWPVGTGPVELVLRAGCDGFGGRDADESDRRPVYGDAVLREPENGCLSLSPWVWSELEARTAADAPDGDCWGVSWAKYESATGETGDISVSFEGFFNRSAESGMECGYYIHPSDPWICLSGSDFGLVFTVCSVLPVIQYTGDGFLYGGVRGGLRARGAGYFQYGSGLPIYERRIHRTSSSAGRSNQHGWTGSGAGQYFCGAAVAECEIRGC